MNTNQRAVLQTSQRMKNRKKSAGTAAVEFAFILPLLVLLAIPIFDMARIIQANMILTNISREGANLASRLQDYPRPPHDPQTIMNAIAATAPPLNMASSGMIYISKIMGNKDGAPNVILEQYGWKQGLNRKQEFIQDSKIWSCDSWVNGKCNILGSRIDDAMVGKLNDGEVIYVVESFYHANILFSAMNLGFGIQTPEFSPDLYAKAIF